MKEAIVSRGPKVKIVDSPMPKARPGQVVTKIVFAGSNPKDWKRPEYWGAKGTGNQGDDHSGVVYQVGEGVSEFRPGERVAAMHEGKQPGGSYAEYGRIPLVIWGASSAVGSYAVQLARRSNIHPLICVAGRAQEHVEKLIDRSKGDTVIDYRKGREAVTEEISASLNGEKLEFAFDAVSEMGSYQTICDVLDHQAGKITLIIPAQSYSDIPKTIQKSVTTVASVHEDLKDFGYVYTRYFSKGLEEGWFKAQPQEIIPGGLEGVEKGLVNLKNGTVSAVKYVYRIADTPGVVE
ncbi:hypothetical protein ACHAP5_003499 [Fusarium lateritium]